MPHPLLHIFRAGRHVSASGEAIEFSAADLKATAEAYDPKVHEAPIVIGHPRDNAPAYGWIAGLDFTDPDLQAAPDQVEPAFAEAVKAGRYKKISASFYTPTSPSNPKPGVYYLRHVGFLGAVPPAVKGLGPVSFAAGEEGVIEFAEPMALGPWEARSIAGLFRRIREFLIDKFDTDTADRVVPSFEVTDLEAAAKRALEAPTPASPAPDFSEEDPAMSNAAAAQAARITELEAALAVAEKARQDAEAAAAARAAEFTEREAALRAQEAAARRTEIEAFVGEQVKAGRVLPARQAQIVAFMAAIAGAADVIEFGEGDQAKKQTPIEAFRDFVANLPPAIDFGERSGGRGVAGAPSEAAEIANKAAELVKERAARGEAISYSEAVLEVRRAAAA